MNTDLYYTAQNNGYIYIPGYCFQSKINYNIDNKASIVRNWNFTDLASVFGVTKNSANNLDKTIAIQYYGSDGQNPNKYSFFRQFWFEDIKPITSITNYTNYFGKDAGVFVRNLDIIKTITSNPENTANYDWINTGINPTIFDTTNYNMLDGIQFIMVLNDGYFVKSWFTDNLTRLQTYSTKFDGNNRSDITDTSPFSTSSLNGSLIFQLEKQNTINNDNNFALKAYQNGKWNYITSNYYGGNQICGFTSSPEYHDVTIINNTNNGNTGLDWNGVRIKQDWSDWNVCAQTAWYHSPKYKIIQPNYKYIFDKLKSQSIFSNVSPKRPIINSTSSSNNSIGINFSTPGIGSSPITSYTVNSYYDGGCSYRNILPTDTNLKTNTDGTLTYTYPNLTLKKSYTGDINKLPTDCLKENYDYIDVFSKPIISHFVNNNSIKENYIFTLNATNNIGNGPISFTNEDVLPLVQISPTGTNIPISPEQTPTEYNVPVSPQFSITQYQNNIFIFITPPLSVSRILYYTISFSQSDKVYTAKVYVDTPYTVQKIEPQGVVGTFSSMSGITIPYKTIPFFLNSSIPSGNYTINITATSSYGTSLPKTLQFIKKPPTPTPTSSTSKYLIISVVIILIILIIIAGFFLLKKN